MSTSSITSPSVPLARVELTWPEGRQGLSLLRLPIPSHGQSAQSESRTRTPFGTSPSSWRDYQFHHLSIDTDGANLLPISYFPLLPAFIPPVGSPPVDPQLLALRASFVPTAFALSTIDRSLSFFVTTHFILLLMTQGRVELPRLSTPDPKSGASTNSAKGSSSTWSRRESNPHAFRHTTLNRA